MRWFHMTVVVLLVLATVIFALQNLQSVTVALLSFRISAPLALLIILVYVLGMISGGSLWSLIRWAVQGAKGRAGA